MVITKRLRLRKFKEDDWCDLTKECANQIIGYAKIC